MNPLTNEEHIAWLEMRVSQLEARLYGQQSYPLTPYFVTTCETRNTEVNANS